FSAGDVFRFCSKFLTTSKNPQREYNRLKILIGKGRKLQDSEDYENAKDREELAILVSQVSKSSVAGKGSTEPLNLIASNQSLINSSPTKKSYLMALMAVLCFGMFLPITSVKSSSQTVVLQSANVKIRTQKWYK